MAVDPEQVRREVANEVRSAYIMERSAHICAQRKVSRPYVPGKQWDGGVTKTGKRCESVWPRIADVVLRNGLDPLMHVRAQFQHYAPKAPMPTHCQSAASVERTKRLMRTETACLRVAFASQMETYMTAVMEIQDLHDWTKTVSWLHVLRDESLPLSALFRLCQAVSLRKKIARPTIRRYQVGAMLQYLRNAKGYDEVWGDKIPPRFRKAARTLGIRLGLVLEDDDGEG